MKLFRSYKSYSVLKGSVSFQRFRLNSSIGRIATAVLVSLVTLLLLSATAAAPGSKWQSKPLSVVLTALSPLPFIDAPKATPQAVGNNNAVAIHSGIKATIFWVGEAADASNGYIANRSSAWDEDWQTHFGRSDAPNEPPTTPLENPYYIALPYNDVSIDGQRKTTAARCKVYASQITNDRSWCKNIWVAVKTNSKTVYAQWQDVGPFEEDDAAYVFDFAAPKNTFGVKAGIDLSPTTAKALGVGDVSKVDWWFVKAEAVPAGPWKTIVTTNPGGILL